MSTTTIWYAVPTQTGKLRHKYVAHYTRNLRDKGFQGFLAEKCVEHYCRGNGCSFESVELILYEHERSRKPLGRFEVQTNFLLYAKRM